MKTIQTNNLAKVKAPPLQLKHTAIGASRDKFSNILAATCVNFTMDNLFLTVTNPP